MIFGVCVVCDQVRTAQIQAACFFFVYLHLRLISTSKCAAAALLLHQQLAVQQTAVA